MSTKKKEQKSKMEDPISESEEEVIDLCDDPNYQVLSAVFETDSGRNVAEILSKIQKDVHLLAMSVHQLIQLSLASHQANKNDESEDEEREASD